MLSRGGTTLFKPQSRHYLWSTGSTARAVPRSSGHQRAAGPITGLEEFRSERDGRRTKTKEVDSTSLTVFFPNTVRQSLVQDPTRASARPWASPSAALGLEYDMEVIYFRFQRMIKLVTGHVSCRESLYCYYRGSSNN